MVSFLSVLGPLPSVLGHLMNAPLPSNETQRLRALADYHVLDTAPEQAFDDLTRLAAQICGSDISLVSLVDHDRQWFKSKFGLHVSQTPREQSFCAHAILDPTNVLIVPDATADERFAQNPLVTSDPRIRFYAGTPLLNAEGLALGSLCVIDRKPRQLSDHQLSALRILGRQVSYVLELRRISAALARVLSNK
jgi:GAF domain-containing protein